MLSPHTDSFICVELSSVSISSCTKPVDTGFAGFTEVTLATTFTNTQSSIEATSRSLTSLAPLVTTDDGDAQAENLEKYYHVLGNWEMLIDMQLQLRRWDTY